MGRERKCVRDGELGGDRVGRVRLCECVKGDLEVCHVGCDGAADSGRAKVAFCRSNRNAVMGWLETIHATITERLVSV